MAWHLNLPFSTVYQGIRTVFTRQTILSATLCSLAVGSVLPAHAANVGDMTIKSSQHETLSASFDVTDIDSADFSATLANPELYQQMGLTPNNSIEVRFIPTSENSGKVVLTSSDPISAPFTDIVLTFTEHGKQQIVPKTLLMPIADSAVLDNDPQMVAESANRPDLPVISPDIPNEDPIPSPTINDNEVIVSATNNNFPEVSTTNSPDMDSFGPQEDLDNQIAKVEDANNVITPVPNATKYNKQTKNDKQKEAVTASVNNNKQQEILTKTITYEYIPLDEYQARKAQEAQAKANPESNLLAQQSESKKDKRNKGKSEDMPIADQASGNNTYIVQKNDNLWSIANTLATQNNLSIQDVMKEILAQNPDAFVGGKADRLKANATLSLPSYQVVPSQQAIKAAIDAHRQSDDVQTKNHPKKSNKSSQKATKNITAKNNSKQGSNARSTYTKTLPRAQMTLVTPSQRGSALGTQTKLSAIAGKNGNSDLVGTLKSNRQQTANQAKRVNSLNDQMSSYTQKLQVQNQKIAELEKRLKELRN